jgi:integrase
MTQRLHEVLSRRHNERDENNSWVFWHIYFDLTGKKKTGPYRDRDKIMRSLCQKAGVKYFRFHALRHASASVLDQRGARSVISKESWDMRTGEPPKFISTVSVMTNVRP